MVALSPRRHAPRNRRKLALLLEQAAEDMATLSSEAVSLLASSRRTGELSPNALTSLARLAAQGRDRVADRLSALGVVLASPPALSPQGLPPLAGAAALSAFIGTYRRCGRRLCLAQQEAREVADGATADVVFFLLRDLERQLWLLDGGRGSVPFETMAPPAVLQFC